MWPINNRRFDLDHVIKNDKSAPSIKGIVAMAGFARVV
jgi:hypothetical protein